MDFFFLIVSFLESSPKLKPKVVKRVAPVPGSPKQQNIALSRPVAMNIDQTKGMLPPPNIPAKPSSPVQIIKPIVTPRRMSSTSIQKERSTSPVPITISSFDNMPQSPESSGSSENLVKSEEPSLDANKAATSPPHNLRPSRKVNEVTTIKRQPKTGWL